MIDQPHELVCAACGHTVFTADEGQYECCKCGACTTELVTTSASRQQLENAFEPKSRRSES